MDEISSNLPQVFIDNDIPTVQGELTALANLSHKFRTASKVSTILRASYSSLNLADNQNGLDTLFNQLTKPRLRSLLDDIYRDVTYDLDDDSFAEAEDLDIVRKRFIRAWEQLVDGYRVCPSSSRSTDRSKRVMRR